ncbi:DUF2079 domain-containing protein [archaeon]|nr:DUF2079 domain-containing protein [archaeon]
MNSNKKLVIWYIIIYTIILTSITILLHQNCFSGWDLGLQENVFWNTINGNFFFSDEFNMNYLGMHFNIIFIFMFPIYYLFPFTGTILFLQALSLALGIIPLYLILKEMFKESRITKIILLLYAISPIIWINNLFDFHPVIFTVPILFSVFYFLEKKNWRYYFIFLLLLIFIKENISITIFFIGLYILIFRKNRKIGLLTCLIAVIWVLMFTNFMPNLSSTNQYFFLERFGNPNTNLGEAITTNILHPSQVLSQISAEKEYILFHLKLFIVLPLASVSVIIAIPTILINILSSHQYQTNPLLYYNIILVPIFFYSFLLVVKKIAKIISKRNLSIILCIILLFSLVSSVYYAGFFLTQNVYSKNSTFVANNQLFFDTMYHDSMSNNNLNFVMPILTPITTCNKYPGEIRSILKEIPRNKTMITSGDIYSQIIKHRSGTVARQISNFSRFEEYTNYDYIIIDFVQNYINKEIDLNSFLETSKEEYDLEWQKESLIILKKKY